MKFIETNKHRLMEKETMELAMAWYSRYKEKCSQMEQIDKELTSFEQWLDDQMAKGNTVSVAEIQKRWSKVVHLNYYG